MRATVIKLGDSYAIQIPAAIVQEMNLKEGTPVEIAASPTGLRVTPVQQRFSLEELVAQMRPENQHDEYFLDKPVGAEIVEWRD
ncbi:AbrB/MazE/SpoVT family DNA-binding domain-containing protein [Niveispirillum fermenti]|uniref:AbrB/MazE/SpoVT family DNA-binding domain-containing protein n=1 Tax=Niveispirillum fermenti TaxID=1233113 RepID=UPI003A874253